MLVLAQTGLLTDEIPENALFLPMPLKVHELISSLELMALTQEKKRKKRRHGPRVRKQEDLEIIDQAKKMLIERNHMTEEEAHRYIQKCSMNSGNSLVETAEMIISLIA